MSVLRVSHIAKAYGGVQAVKDFSLEIDRGQIIALIGPNGAGKSTCFNVINGQIKADAGSIMFMGREIRGRRPREIWKLGVGRTFQVPQIYGSMTVGENVQMTLMSKHGDLANPFRRANRLHREQATALLERVGLAEHAERAASVLSYGDLKRLEVVMAIANDPILLLMDEPTAGMAPAERDQLMALTADLVRERNLAVLFTEHSMDVVFSYAHRILVLSRGSVIAAGSPDAVRQDPEVQEVYLGTMALRDDRERARA